MKATPLEWTEKWETHLAESKVDSSEAFIGLQEQQQISWHAPEQLVDLLGKGLCMFLQVLLLLLAPGNVQMIG